ncbi:glycerophosphoryl diester phosphodiesterase [Terrihabitans soli]|uniref:glycerophosphodiester phosphodiesterase n=1 Tax=Terrihabitans soli TaxID=708113 RepID=A0A6S6QNR8_9HYPH|nr:glycerophosphodiester phosphodiesterase [Terrihabitans soli]BCJ90599.1 glycerophosphoryl diester phosphodiesterase [Terrihabitans soli]
MLRTFASAILISATVLAAPAAFAQNAQPLVIGHRGAPGYFPDHTIEGYTKAIESGVDFIEPDLVSTKDGVLIARHEPMLGGTTDISERKEFADRKTTKKLDGFDVTDWFASDFTFAEIKTLKAKQPMADRDQSHNGKYAIPSLDEVIELAKKKSTETGRTIGIYPEVKHSIFHAAQGLAIEDKLVDRLKKEGWTEKTSPVIIQSFETANLKYLHTRTNVRLVQLVDAEDVDKDGNIVLVAPLEQPYDYVVAGDKRTFKDLVTPAGLAEIKTYADGVGPWKPYLMAGKQTDANNDGKPDDLNGDGAVDERDRVLIKDTGVVKAAHDLGLFVHTWTFRSEPKRLASDYKNDPVAEYRAFFDLGVDGVFSDYPDHAVKARGVAQR